MSSRQTGGCLCGDVTYAAEGPFRPVVACHCGQCRRTSGHFVAATAVAAHKLHVTGEVAWFESSPGVQRGFCPLCGSNLFWRNGSAQSVSVFAGTLDQPTGLELACHIHADARGDYYQISDGTPQYAGDCPDEQHWEAE